MTKDFGENWTHIQLNSLPPFGAAPYNQAVPTNNPADPQYAITDDIEGNLDLALTVDPADPNITYLGGFGGNGYNSDTGLIRVDATDLNDAHALVNGLDQTPNFDFRSKPQGATTYNNIEYGDPVWINPATDELDPTPYLNFIRNPYDPFLEDSTLYVENYASFSNTGLGATWTPFDVPVTSAFVPSGSFLGTLAVGSSTITGISSTPAGCSPGIPSSARASRPGRSSRASTVRPPSRSRRPRRAPAPSTSTPRSRAPATRRPSRRSTRPPACPG